MRNSKIKIKEISILLKYFRIDYFADPPCFATWKGYVFVITAFRVWIEKPYKKWFYRMCLYRYTKVLRLLIIGRNFIKCVMPFDKLSCTIWNISNIWLDTRVYLLAQLIVCCISFLYSSEYCFITFLSCGWLFWL